MNTIQIIISGSEYKKFEIKNKNIIKELHWLVLLKLCLPLFIYHTKTNAIKSKYYFKYNNLGAILKNTKLLQLFNKLHEQVPNRYTISCSNDNELIYYNLLCDELIVNLLYQHLNIRMEYTKIVIRSIPTFNWIVDISNDLVATGCDSIYDDATIYMINKIFKYLYSEVKNGNTSKYFRT